MKVRRLLIFASLIGGAAILAVVACFAYPIIPNTGIGVIEDVTLVATASQLQNGITLSVPHTASQNVETLAFEPFKLEPDTGCQPVTAGIQKCILKLTTSSITPGAYLSAIAMVGDKPRKITINVAVPPFCPALVTLIGLLFAYLASLWISYGRTGQLLQAKALEALDGLWQRDATLGDVDSDGEQEYSLMQYAQEMIGIGEPPPIGSLRERVVVGDFDGAAERLAALGTFVQKYETSIGEIRKLYNEYRELEANFPQNSPPWIIRAADQLINVPNGPRQVDDSSLQDIDSCVKILQETFPLLRQIYPYYQKAVVFVNELDRISTQLSSEDLKAFETAKVKLIDAYNAVERSRTKDELEDAKPNIIEVVDKTLRPLWSIYKGAQAAPEDAVAPPTPPRSSGTAPQDTLGAQANRIRNSVAVADWFFLMIGMLVALVTAMSALYIGKPFGTPFDYLIAFLWGVGVDQAIKGLGEVLKKLGVPVAVGVAGVKSS